MSDVFFQVQQKAYPTSQGPVELPILYYDVSVFQAFFKVSAAAAEKMLSGTGLRPVLAGKDALVGLAFFEYRRTSIGPYNEVGVCLACYPAYENGQPSAIRDFLRPSLQRKLGFHILDLPVTTPAANAAGRELWGYPKFVAEIPLAFGPGRFEGAVLDPGSPAPIVTLTGTHGAALPVTGIDLVLFSHLDGALLKTVVDVDAKFHTALGAGFTLSVGASKHRMAENLRALGLHGASPVGIQRTDAFRSRLHAGRKASDLTASAPR
jgi:hypothetical protein